MPDGQDSVVSAVRQMSAGPVAANAARVDRERSFPAESVAALGAIGGLGILVPESHGGAGGGLLLLSEACQAVGSACASTGMVYLMHSVAAATVAAGGGQRTLQYLETLRTGATVGTLAFSERGTGAHFYAPELQATPSNGGIAISGRKSFVTSGGHADIYLVLVRSDTSDGLDCFVVERTAPGVRFEGEWQGLGMTGNSSVAMEFDDVAIDRSAQIGAPGAGADLVFSVVAPLFLVGLASINVGVATAAVTSATAHAATRTYPDGSTLAEVQGIQHLLADMDIAVRAARLSVREAARLGDAGDEDALVAIMEAKVLATDTAARVTQSALEVCGGQGYTAALPIERHLRDARAGAIMAPTNAVLRSWIGKSLAGLPVP
jgi:isovaleryl-CoA dehydrogenase